MHQALSHLRNGVALSSSQSVETRVTILRFVAYSVTEGCAERGHASTAEHFARGLTVGAPSLGQVRHNMMAEHTSDTTPADQRFRHTDSLCWTSRQHWRCNGPARLGQRWLGNEPAHEDERQLAFVSSPGREKRRKRVTQKSGAGSPPRLLLPCEFQSSDSRNWLTTLLICWANLGVIRSMCCAPRTHQTEA